MKYPHISAGFGLVLILLVVVSCTDTNIEGLSSSASGFIITKSTVTNGAINLGGCYSQSTNKNGTTFTLDLTYQSSETISGISAVYKFSSGVLGTLQLQKNTDYVDYGSGSSGATGSFRGGATGTSHVSITQCVLFGSTTSITYTFTITTSSGKAYATVVVVAKPSGAN